MRNTTGTTKPHSTPIAASLVAVVVVAFILANLSFANEATEKPGTKEVVIDPWQEGMKVKTLSLVTFSPSRCMFAGVYKEDKNTFVSIHTDRRTQIAEIVTTDDRVTALKFLADGKLLISWAKKGDQRWTGACRRCHCPVPEPDQPPANNRED